MVKKKKSEKGFTLINTLISFFLVLLTLPLIFQLTYHVKSMSNVNFSPYKFIIYVKDDFHRAEHLRAKDNKLYFYLKSDEIAILEKYGDSIRRKVDNRGHEIYLRGISDFKTEQLDYGVRIIIVSKAGDRYEKVVKTNKQ